MSGAAGNHRSPWASTGEPQVVSGKRLAAIIQRFINQWEADRPNGTGQRGYGDKNGGFLGPQQYLAEQTGINIRQIGRIVHAEQKWVGLSKADAILQVIGTGERVGTDLQVRRNPVWSQERWHEYMSSRGCA